MTNAQMVQRLMDDFEPRNRGIICPDEVVRVERILNIKDRKNITDLRNLRDTVVMWFSIHNEGINDMNKIMVNMDKLSAITYVIDEAIWNLGGEV